MALQMKKRDDLDSLFADLGVVSMPDGITLPDSESLPTSESEDPFARFLEPKSETAKEENEAKDSKESLPENKEN